MTRTMTRRMFHGTAALLGAWLAPLSVMPRPVAPAPPPAPPAPEPPTPHERAVEQRLRSDWAYLARYKEENAKLGPPKRGEDRVGVRGVKGSPPPDTLKVGTPAFAGFRNSMTFVLCGLQIEEKAALVERQLRRRLRHELEFECWLSP